MAVSRDSVVTACVLVPWCSRQWPAEDGALERQVAPGDEFEIRYTHSVARTVVLEKFRVRPDGKITVFETIYQDFGAGLPSELDEGAQVEVGPGGVRITGMERVMSSIPLRVGSIARHQIALGSDVVDLISLVEPGELVDIAVAAKAMLCAEEVASLWA